MRLSRVFNAAPKRVAIAMSGGVDSSVAAYILQHSSSQTKPASRRNHHELELVGLHMNNWNAADEEEQEDGNKNGQPQQRNTTFCVQSEKDASDAQSVCDLLQMKMHKVSFAGEYWTGVFEPFIHGIENGMTTNPDVGCNSIVKFGAMRDYAMKHLQADYIATGHYARLWHRDHSDNNNDHISSYLHQSSSLPIRDIVEEAVVDTPERDWIFSWGSSSSDSDNSSMNKCPLLLAGADLTKDQSYFLCGVNGYSFSNALFPLGHLIKKTKDVELLLDNQNNDDGTINNNDDDQHIMSNMSVREIAIKSGLPTASKKESMGICFIGKRNFPNFISQYMSYEETPGNFVDIDTGEIVGQHNGCSNYTIGQGAKISGAKQKWFITKKDLTKNIILVCSNTHHPSLYAKELYIQCNEFNWITGRMPPPMMKTMMKDGFGSSSSIRALCRIRHLQPLIPCQVFWNREESKYTIHFDYPIRAITPGQTAALYVGKNGIVCLGGGPISNHGPTYYDLGLTLPSNLHPAGHNDLSI